MSSDALVAVPDRAVQGVDDRPRNRRQAETFRKVLAAGMQTLRENSYTDLTVRMVAARAKVAPATAYTYFSSKNHLIAEVYLDLVRQVPYFTDVNVPMPVRVDQALRHLALVVADEPEVGAACTAALLGGGADPAVRAAASESAPRSTGVSRRPSDPAPSPPPYPPCRWRSSGRWCKPAAASSPITRSPTAWPMRCG
ncbi:bacterial regulatory s, tetR family protein [Mycobacterium kansasii]|uniref:Bacterial regulatory s, tetR family protein n=1 Tax=Mycobacterium kansasii TaxID=1768 RepID=A0A1V3WTZ1_MYCKA|nr:bacterial regulatory s, tetR family protein [Mycobacterium kansasii]